jgi:hypothetical protein
VPLVTPLRVSTSPVWYPPTHDPRIAPQPNNPGPPELAVPRMRVFPWVLNCTVLNSRYSFSTPTLIGPAIITDIVVYVTSGVDPPIPTLEVGTSLGLVRENGVALTTLRPYTVLMEYQDPFAYAVPSAGGVGIPFWTVPTASNERRYWLGYRVQDPSFRLVIAIVQGGNAIKASGVIRCAEAIDTANLSAYPP